ncbi:hypothetical protein, partial [Burkholderia ubonensis]|uniref:hypothetical protein n=1 Tax=Burkholderia ubonensis TaxID=101571 RepID=UPI000A691A3B
YIRIGNQFYRSNLRPDASGTMQRGVFRPNNSTDRVDVERIGGRWTVLPDENKLRGGAGGNAIQDKWKADYWKKDLPSNELNNALTKKKAFWENYTRDAKRAGFKEKGQPRTLAQIVESGKGLLDNFAQKRQDLPRFEAYRAMGKDEAKGIFEWLKNKVEIENFIKNGARPAGGDNQLAGKELSEYLKSGNRIIPIRNHLGDWEQAKRYTQADVVMKFTLKPGADELLFDPKYMAVSRGGGDATIALVMQQAKKDGIKYYQAASGNEGALGGYVGLKSEAHGPFSLSLGMDSQPSQLLFQLFVEKVEFLHKSTGLSLRDDELKVLLS